MKFVRPIPTRPSVFDRFYVSFDALRKGFLKDCLPVIWLDGWFLKTIVKGQLLTNIGRVETTKCSL